MEEQFIDKELTCNECSGIILWTARDQEFYKDNGFEDPKRCKECRQKRKAQKKWQ